MKRYGLRDDQFARIETLLPGRPGTVGRSSELGNRLFVEAVIWKFRSGAPWRDLPERFGDWKNTRKRFSRWAASGVWESLFKTLADDPDNEYAMIDATIVRAHQHSAGACKKGGYDQAIGRSRGGLTTKIHVIVDALGNPLALIRRAFRLVMADLAKIQNLSRRRADLTDRLLRKLTEEINANN